LHKSEEIVGVEVEVEAHPEPSLRSLLNYPEEEEVVGVEMVQARRKTWKLGRPDQRFWRRLVVANDVEGGQLANDTV
jgi:hypothetical protein